MPPSPPTPAWLTDGPLTQRARAEHCQRCGRLTLRALVDGLTVRVDPIHTTAADQLAARLAGREVLRAYDLQPAPRLSWHWHWHMRPGAHAADDPVLLQHDCRRWPPRDDPPDRRLFSLPPAPPANLEEPPW